MGNVRKIAVIGDTGSGKSTFAKALSKKLNIPYFEADMYRFKNGTKRTDEEYLSDIDKITSQESWVFDGAHTIAGPIAWTRADLVIYLKFPTRILLWKIVKRAFLRLITREEYPHGGKESFSNLFGKEGWISSFYAKTKERREGYEKQFEKIGRDNINIVIVGNPRELKKYLLDGMKEYKS